MLTGDWANPYPNCKYAVISIYTRSNDIFFIEATINAFKEMGMLDQLSLQFWDVDGKDKEKILAQYPHAVFFDKTHAVKIIDFVQELNKKEEDIGLIVHCDAGISRSGAAGMFITEYLGLDVNYPRINSWACLVAGTKRLGG